MKLRVIAFTIIVALAQLYFMNVPLDEAALTQPAVRSAGAVSVAAQSRNKVCASFGEIERQINRALSERQAELDVLYAGDTSRLKADIDEAFAHIFEEDNYIHYVAKSYQAEYAYRPGQADIRFSFTYWETKAETDYVEANAPVLLASIVRPDMTDVQKELAIHDWIAAHVAFDESLDKHSAYSALAELKAVCQGYALLAYKMLKLAGIEARIVEGVAGNEQHIWNMVKLDGRWYHIDVTWDRAVAGIRGIRHSYFNVSDSAIGQDHHWTLAYPKADSPLYAAK